MAEEQKVVEMEVKETTENGQTTVVAEPKEKWTTKFKRSWIWKNRGKIGAGIGAVGGFVGAMLLGNKNDEGPTE